MVNLSTGQVVAFSRHILTFAGGAITALAALHVITSGDANSAMQAISNIGDGISKIAAGVGTLIGIASGLYAAWSASPFSQLIAVSKNPEVTQVVVKDSNVANSVPSPKVVSQ